MTEKTRQGRAARKAKPGQDLVAARMDEPWPEETVAEQHRPLARAAKERVFKRPRRPLLKMTTEDGQRRMVVGGETHDVLDSILLHDVAGSSSTPVAHYMLDQLAELVSISGNDETDTNRLTAALAMVAAVDPQDELECMMALQMVAANQAALSNFKLSRTNAQLPEFSQRFSNMANKAMRSFALHVEAIEKRRRGGVQEVRHTHVDVRAGGQAVIAETVNNGGSKG